METFDKYNRYAVRIPKGVGVGGGGGWKPKFQRPGVGGPYPIQTHSDRQKKGEGVGCKNWTFFMDVINVWSLTG